MYYLGLDFGTSGARACVIDKQQTALWQRAIFWPAGDPDAPMQPANWRQALLELITQIPISLRSKLGALAIDATSGTVLLVDEHGAPVSPVLPYNHPLAHDPAAKLTWLRQHDTQQRAYLLMHQIDYLNRQLLGHYAASDWHNALKSGFDPQTLSWRPHASADIGLLPPVVAPGSIIGHISPAISQQTGLPVDCQVCAGTTDSIAAFLAASPLTPGSAVTSLGSTLVIKLLSTTPVWSFEHGIYSHRLDRSGKLWLTGGASNSGGAVLSHYFDVATLERLSANIQPDRPSGLDYYPLLQPGERFPVHDPHLAPRIDPRPDDHSLWLHGMLEGIARIEQQGYAQLVALGATPPTQIMTTGGGSRNPAWQAIRQRLLNLPIQRAAHDEAAYGSALLAKRAADLFL